MKLLSIMAVPIEQPLIPLTLKKQPRNYFFDHVTRFSHYEFFQQNENLDILKDDLNQWYFISKMHCDNLRQLKAFRQIHPESTALYKSLPLVDILEHFNLQLDIHDYDKAFSHVLCLTDNIDSIPLHTQMHIANYESESDPILTAEMHYFHTVEEGARTRFISGIESRSFATITESKHFAEEVWEKHIGITYLKLFLYYKQYKTIPSHQMMAKLLCNLFASTEALNYTSNPSLYKILEL